MRFRWPWGAALPLLILGLWHAIAAARWASRSVLPGPSDVLVAAWNLLRDGGLLSHLAVSAVRAAVGFILGGSVGFLFGLWTGTSRWAERLFDST